MHSLYIYTYVYMCRAHNRSNGWGLLSYKNGDLYLGSFRNGLFDGPGTWIQGVYVYMFMCVCVCIHARVHIHTHT